MIWSDLLRAGIVLLLVTIDQAEELPLLYALVALQMGVSIFFDAARSASVPNTVPRDELLDAQALSAATWSAMLAVGAALSGGLLAIMGTRGVFFMDAATFCLSALLLVGIRLPRPVRGEQVRWWKMPARNLRLHPTPESGPGRPHEGGCNGSGPDRDVDRLERIPDQADRGGPDLSLIHI